MAMRQFLAMRYHGDMKRLMSLWAASNSKIPIFTHSDFPFNFFFNSRYIFERSWYEDLKNNVFKGLKCKYTNTNIYSLLTTSLVSTASPPLCGAQASDDFHTNTTTFAKTQCLSMFGLQTLKVQISQSLSQGVSHPLRTRIFHFKTRNFLLWQKICGFGIL